MEEEASREIGGRPFLVKWGNRFNRWGDKLLKKGSKTLISNPKSKLLDPFLLKIDFTVNNTKKYQLVMQGDYKSRYKDYGTDENPLSVSEMFMLITSNQSKWYLKT